jgi:hypothetical protein
MYLAALATALWMAGPSLADNPQDRMILGSGALSKAGATTGKECTDPEDDTTCTHFVATTTLEVEGDARAQGGGKGSFEATLVANWEAALPNGTVGKACAPASGQIEVRVANGSSFIASLGGLACGEVPSPADEGEQATIPAQTFEGSFTLVSSSGKFSKYAGTGDVTLQEDGDGNVLLRLDGVFEKR